MGARRVGGSKYRFFKPSPQMFVMCFSLWGVFSWNFWPRFKAVAHPKCTFGLLWCHFVRAPRRRETLNSLKAETVQTVSKFSEFEIGLKSLRLGVGPILNSLNSLNCLNSRPKAHAQIAQQSSSIKPQGLENTLALKIFIINTKRN